jgi:UDP-2,3-diacylglucosamine hydrolase
VVKIDSAVFFSDTHLCITESETADLLLGSLGEMLQDTDHIFILGDLFEAWLGDDNTDAIGERFATEFNRLKSPASKSWFLHGNRDFLIGTAWLNKIGAQLLADPTKIFLGPSEMPCLLSHGDAWCLGDVPYQHFRKQVRAPAWQEQFLALPLGERSAIAQQMRQASKQAKSGKSLEIMDVDQTALALSCQQHACSIVIHGHTHRPKHHSNADNASQTHVAPPQHRYVLPDWQAAKGLDKLRGGWLSYKNECFKQHGVWA